jgi:predicted dehydrogenase
MSEPHASSSAPADPQRRNFLKAAAAAGLSLALARPGSLRAQNPATPSNTLNIALVGIGEQGKVLTEALLKIPGIRFAAVCDIWEYARTYGQRLLKRSGFEVNAYEDYRELLQKERDLDAVIVATPDSWHAPVTNDALRAGHHVYCEKMMSNTIEGARSMVRTMRETGKLLQIGHQRRSNPRYMIVRERLLREAKLFGRITAAQAQWNRAAGPDLGWPQRATIPADVLARYGFDSMHQFRNWRWFRKHGGGPLSDLGAHQIDIFNWFLDAVPVSVMGSGGVDYYSTHEWMDNAMVIFDFKLPEGAARAFYQVQTTTSSGGGYWEQFMGDQGTLRISENPRHTALYREAAAPSWEEWVRRRFISAPPAPAPTVATASPVQVDVRETAALAAYNLPIILSKAIHQPHLENFFDAIRGRAKLNCPADEAFHSEMAIFKAVEAVEKRQLITLEPGDFVV